MHTHTHTYEGSSEHMSMTERLELLVKCLLWPQIKMPAPGLFLPTVLPPSSPRETDAIHREQRALDPG